MCPTSEVFTRFVLASMEEDGRDTFRSGGRRLWSNIPNAFPNNAVTLLLLLFFWGLGGGGGSQTERCTVFYTVSKIRKGSRKSYPWGHRLEQHSDKYWMSIKLKGACMLEIITKKKVKTEAAVWKLRLQRFQPSFLWLFLGLNRDVTPWCEINYTAVGSKPTSRLDRSADIVRTCARTSNFLCCAASQVFSSLIHSEPHGCWDLTGMCGVWVLRN